MYIPIYIYLLDDGLVEAETCWRYVNVNNRIQKTDQCIWLVSNKYSKLFCYITYLMRGLLQFCIYECYT